jgi:hypothetical protein
MEFPQKMPKEVTHYAPQRLDKSANADARIAAVKALAALSLPVGTPREMKEESV